MIASIGSKRGVASWFFLKFIERRASEKFLIYVFDGIDGFVILE
jgi:hypothetical protein